MKLKKQEQKITSQDKKDHQQALLDHYQHKTLPKYTGQDMPFFILGSPRSGTTLLRDLLRDHPRLECPEETHFFRWADPFGSPKFITHYKTKLFKEHRKMDGVDEIEFALMMHCAHSREHLSWLYGQEFLKGIGKPEARLYDKTPQNVYGVFLINAIYPQAKFIHIYRNPLNVVTSLMEGKVMPVHTLRGAINSWVESMMLLEQFKKFRPELLLELPYEELTDNPDPGLKKILEFVNEDPALLPSQTKKTHKEKNKYKDKLSEQEIQVIIDKCEPFYSQYGYRDDTQKDSKGFFEKLFS